MRWSTRTPSPSRRIPSTRRWCWRRRAGEACLRSGRPSFGNCWDMTTTIEGNARKLADGRLMPLLGLGVWQVEPGEETENSVRWALELGYRHIDTAQAYGNEEGVGKALADSGMPREESFLTTKFYPDHDDSEAEAEKSFE